MRPGFVTLVVLSVLGGVCVECGVTELSLLADTATTHLEREKPLPGEELWGAPEPLNPAGDGEPRGLKGTGTAERYKRFALIGLLQRDLPHQECEAPGGQRGHCRHLHHCLHRGLGPLQIASHSCIIQLGFRYLGVCCPDEEATSPSSVQIEGAERPARQPQGREDDSVEENDLEAIVFKTSSDEMTDFASEIKGCGVSNKQETKIMGGRPAGLKDWPWMAALLRPSYRPGGWEAFCGAALISSTHLLTAAHCLTNYQPHEIRARLGEYDFARTDEVPHRDFRITEMRMHPDYNDSTYHLNDLAILRLHASSVSVTDVRPICLPSPNEDFENKFATVTGWGTVSFGGPTSDLLLEVRLPIWPQQRCSTALGRILPRSTLCAGTLRGGRDSCQGDSGGPLMLRQDGGQYVLVGVVSSGVGCGQRGRPGLYTRISHFLPWITDNTI